MVVATIALLPGRDCRVVALDLPASEDPPARVTFDRDAEGNERSIVDKGEGLPLTTAVENILGKDCIGHANSIDGRGNAALIALAT